MNELLQSPEIVRWWLVLLRISLILGTAWVGHFLLQRCNPRWQILLWRSAFALVLMISFASPWLAGWGFRLGDSTRSNLLQNPAVVVQNASAAFRESEDHADKPSDSVSSRPVSASPTQPKASSSTSSVFVAVPASPVVVVVRTLCGGYLLMVVCHVLMLMAEAVRLSQILRRCVPANERLTHLVARIATQSGMKNVPAVVMSEEIFGPMATGLLKTRIVIPAGLPDQLTERQQEFVIAHECSHIRNNDLWWSTFLGMLRIALWPHPLVWRLPATHRLACDLRCDAAAAGHDSSDYGTMLAQMALTICAKPQPRMSLAFLTRSEVLHRIRRIQSGTGDDPLTSRHRLMATLMILTLCVAGTAGINGCSEDGGFFAASDHDAVETIQVTVMGADGNPVKDAEVRVDGLRAAKESASAHGNRLMTQGTTNEQGVAFVSYPKYVYEEMATGQLIITVTHPEFVMIHSDHGIGSPIEIRLNAGRRLTVTAIDAATGTSIQEGLYGLLPGRIGGEVWNPIKDGTLTSNVLAPETRTLLLVCVREGQPTLFSDLIDLNDYSSEHAEITNVAMSPGERLSGQLSDNVPRPVGDGRVGLCISMTFDGNPSYDTVAWNDYTSIKPDGTFTFDSVPRGAEIQLTAVNDDWVSVSAPPAEILGRFPYVTTAEHAQHMHDTIVTGQSFAPEAARSLVLEMEPTATCNFTVVDDSGEAVEGAAIYMSPNMASAPGPGGIIGTYFRTVDSLGKTTKELRTASREKRKTVLASNNSKDRFGRYMVMTGKSGKATLRALPGKRGEGIKLEHERFELGPMKHAPFHRGENVDLTPGQTTEVKLTVQKKGVEVLGR